MEFTYAALSSTGPVRENNEDYLECFTPATLDERRSRGALLVIADGVGGHGDGEKASSLAVAMALEQFKLAEPNTQPAQIVGKIFDAANTAVYDAGMQGRRREQGRMATTLTVALLRNNELTIGHVGDCRTYLIHKGKIELITTDHSYVGLQRRMGLITEEEAMTSDLRSMLTRTVGENMTVSPDTHTVLLNKHDILVQCSDGLHGWVTEAEICEAVLLYEPQHACRFLVDLACKKKGEDNISVQVARIEQVEQVGYYRGLPYYMPANEASTTDELQPGQILDKRFLLIDLVASTGVVSIFKATDLATKETVAIKIPLPQYSKDPDVATQLDREEQIGGSMSHPGVLRIVPVENKSRPYIVSEFLEGETLANILMKVKKIPVADAINIGSRLCGALDYMHCRRMNVVHRDLKPANIMICNDGSIRILDFGIAKATGSRSVNFAGYTPAVGTPDYLAPEQFKGEHGDERTDIYSLGAILYEMTSGQAPFDGYNAYALMNARLTADPVEPHRINPEIPAAFEAIVLKAMQREPVDRFNSAAEMKQHLDLLDQSAISRQQKRFKSHLIQMRILQVACAIVLVLILFFIWRR